MTERQVGQEQGEGEPPFTVIVECDHDAFGEEIPRSILMGHRTVEVLDVIDRWLDDDHSYFKVRGDDRAVYILRHDPYAGRWEIAVYDSGALIHDKLSST